MEDQCSPLSWPCYYQEEGIEELKNSLLYTTLELETTIVCAHEELARKSDELMHLKALLTKTIKERDEAQSKCQSLMMDKLLLQQHIQDEPIAGGDSNNTGFSSSGSDDNTVASPPLPPPPPPQPEVTEKLVLKRPLPEKGKFLQAVMEAGPLLQTLLLAGPLPRWQHPPPPLNTGEIPPVTISSPRPCASSSTSKKRGLVEYCEGSNNCSPKTKNQKSSSPIIIDKYLVHPHN